MNNGGGVNNGLNSNVGNRGGLDGRKLLKGGVAYDNKLKVSSQYNIMS